MIACAARPWLIGARTTLLFVFGTETAFLNQGVSNVWNGIGKDGVVREMFCILGMRHPDVRRMNASKKVISDFLRLACLLDRAHQLIETGPAHEVELQPFIEPSVGTPAQHQLQEQSTNNRQI